MVKKDELKREDDRQEPTKAEKAVMAASAIFTLAVLSYLIWQAATLEDGSAPTVTVTLMETTPEGDVRVEVLLDNRGAAGLRSATVAVECSTPPPSITFSNIPANGTRTGNVLCPPGTTSPKTKVETWVPA